MKFLGPMSGFVALGTALFWGFAAGLLHLWLVAPKFGSAGVALQYAAGAGLLQAVTSAAVALPLGFLVQRVAPAPGRGLSVVQVTAVFTPVALAFVQIAQQSLPRGTSALSGVGLAVGAGVFAAVLAAGVGLGVLFGSVGTSRRLGSLAAVGYGISGVALVWVGASLARPPAVAMHADTQRNLILISVDSVRADIWDEYLRDHASQELRQFVDASRRYRDAHTTFSHSLPSHASMLSGLYPPEHGALLYTSVAGSALGSPVDPNIELLQQRLGRAGYATGAVVANDWLGPAYGLEAGFDTFINYGDAQRLAVFDPLQVLTVSLVGSYLRYAARYLGGVVHPSSRLFIRWLHTRDPGRPFFGFLHYIEMHTPNQRVGSEHFCSGPLADVGGRALKERVDAGAFSPQEMDAVRAQVRCLNLATLVQIDAFLQPVFLTLQELGLYRSTLVILVSDHGENLYEGPGTDGHPPAPPHYGHGHAYATVSRIPMVVRVPGDVEGSDWPQLVTLADIPSTAYAFTSVDPNDGLAGRDLLGSAVRVGDDWVLVQGADHGNSGWAEAVVWAGGSKWLVDGAGNEELFNLRDDPGERANLIPDQPELAATARAQFVAIKAGLKLAESTPVGLDALPPEVVERLRALGYVN